MASTAASTAASTDASQAKTTSGMDTTAGSSPSDFTLKDVLLAIRQMNEEMSARFTALETQMYRLTDRVATIETTAAAQAEAFAQFLRQKQLMGIVKRAPELLAAIEIEGHERGSLEYDAIVNEAEEAIVQLRKMGIPTGRRPDFFRRIRYDVDEIDPSTGKATSSFDRNRSTRR